MTQPQRTTYRKLKQPKSNLEAAGQGLVKVCLFLGTLSARIFLFLTNPPGSAILFGLAGIFLSFVSAEAYWVAMPGRHRPFLPKPFIPDKGSLEYLGTAMNDSNFWVALLVALIIIAIEALLIRQVPLPILKARYEAVAHETLPEEEEDDSRSLKLRKIRLRQWRNYGIPNLRLKAGGIILVFSVDLMICLRAFPLWGVGLDLWCAHFVWFLLAWMGAEWSFAMLMEVLSPTENPLEVEVIN